jgi:hypothetical protein
MWIVINNTHEREMRNVWAYCILAGKPRRIWATLKKAMDLNFWKTGDNVEVDLE